MTKRQKEQIHMYRERGYGYGTIAEKLGISKSTISSYCRRNGLSGNSTKEEKHKLQDGRCLECGTPLVHVKNKKPKKFCCNECRQKWWNAHLDRVNKKAYYKFICANCGKEFEAYGNAHRKYCCYECYIEGRFGVLKISES